MKCLGLWQNINTDNNIFIPATEYLYLQQNNYAWNNIFIPETIFFPWRRISLQKKYWSCNEMLVPDTEYLSLQKNI